MDLASLMSNLSVKDNDSNRIHYTTEIDGVPTVFYLAISPGLNVAVVTQTSRLGPLFTGNPKLQNNVEDGSNKIVYLIKRWGSEITDAEPAVQFITDRLDLGRKLMFFLNLKQYNNDIVYKILDELKKHFHK